MGVLGAFFGCRGDGGFNARCSGASIGDGGFTLVCISGCRGDGGFTLACISGRRGVIGFNVATSQQPEREKVRPARPGADVSAKKFALRTKNGPQSAVYGVLGELFRENTAGWAVPGEVFRGTAAEQTVLAEFCRTTTQARLLLGRLRLGSNRKAAC